MHAAEGQAILLTLSKDLCSVKMLFLLSEVALPITPAPRIGVVRSSCFGVLFADLEVNGLPALDSSCDLDDSVVLN